MKRKRSKSGKSHTKRKPKPRKKKTPKTKKRKPKLKKEKPRDKKKRLKEINNRISSGTPKNEYELQVCCHRWIRKAYPYFLVLGTPYGCMFNIKTIQQVKNKGYIKGFPDYVIYDPRVYLNEEDDKLSMDFVYLIAIDFKHPINGGQLSKEQKVIKKVFLSRGGLYYKVTSLAQFQKIVRCHVKRGFPITDTPIEVDLKKFSIHEKKEKDVYPLPYSGKKKVNVCIKRDNMYKRIKY